MDGSSVAPALSNRMRWLQARTRVLADNVANADTPRFIPKDLAAPADARAGLQMSTTNVAHMSAGGAAAGRGQAAPRIETRPGGNAVSLEDEMLRLSETQLEYQMMTGLYQRGLSTLKIAIGRRG